MAKIESSFDYSESVKNMKFLMKVVVPNDRNTVNFLLLLSLLLILFSALITTIWLRILFVEISFYGTAMILAIIWLFFVLTSIPIITLRASKNSSQLSKTIVFYGQLVSFSSSFVIAFHAAISTMGCTLQSDDRFCGGSALYIVPLFFIQAIIYVITQLIYQLTRSISSNNNSSEAPS